ncbi:peptidase U32 family protein [Tepidibacter formicigenes]|jgi:putative protease|uniref:Putative protease n=1 Tax=Tepidibacter formicigenes DSM 15518 TaxID=1123349 RepID=A0A1M6L083_9FIRM|nr:U32 family peptidase [Tepidibacter formicigenes]SHJ64532.1 putative protease [Tepidibacter formicigenes DSM 15518]
MEKVELLAPAGDLEKLKMAITYGADAVYIGGEFFGLRAGAKNFTKEQMEEGVKFAHERGKKVYVTVNIIPHNEDFEGLDEYLKTLEEIGIDAVIVSDPGVLSIVKEVIPNMEVHLSTQANNTNYMSAKFWYKQGVNRIVTARELSFKEIKEIRENIPQDMEIEAFIHGAMCISYSGRCLISNYMTGRDANRGACAHPCRWEYYLVEQKRPGEYFPVYEDERGTFFFNSKDLCMIEYIPEIINSGIKSLKIEGRMKTAYYVASIVRAYRMAIDEYYKDPQNWKFNTMWLDEIKKASHRDFTTGFYFEKPGSQEQHYGSSSYIRNYDFIGLVKEYNEKEGLAVVEQRNRMFIGDEIEIIGPNIETIYANIEKMWTLEGEEIDVAPHPRQIIKMKLNVPVKENYILRKEIKDEK